MSNGLGAPSVYGLGAVPDFFKRKRRNRVIAIGVILCLGIAIGVSAHALQSGESIRAADLFASAGKGKGTDAGSDSGPDSGERDRVPKARAFTISVSGDILIHSPLWEKALADGGGGRYAFEPMFSALDRYVRRADLAICHLETPLTDSPPTGFPIFSTPTDLAGAVKKSGWDGCDTASNHSLDMGLDGIASTVAALRSAKLDHTGSHPGPKAARRIPIFNLGSAKVALLAYTDQTNGIPLPEPWAVNVLAAGDPAPVKVKQVRRDVARATRQGADGVLVSIQWGDENATEPNDSQVELARGIVRIPEVLAIAGQGPHVVQPIRRVAGKYVIYSSGNLLSNQSSLAGLPAETQYGLIGLLRVSVTDDGSEVQMRVKRVDYVPTWVRLSDWLVEPVGWGLKNDPANAESLRAAWNSTVEIVGRGGGIAPVPRRLPSS